MSAPLPLREVLLRPDIWRGDGLARADAACVETGFADLDAELPGGGWPRGALTEVLAQGTGIGELSLMLTALKQAASEGPLVIIAPPQSLHAPAWAAALPQARLWVVECKAADAPWCAEQILASGAVAAVLAWLPNTDARALRRLQLASKGRSGLVFIFRPPKVADSASPAVLRIGLSANARVAGLQLRILKRRGASCERSLSLAIPRPLAWSRLPIAEVLAQPSTRPAPRLRAVPQP